MHEGRPAVDSKQAGIPNQVRYSAVLLAGGKSSRMGSDKALLLVDGTPLWERQWGVLRSLGIEHVYLSGKKEGPWQAKSVAVIEDESPELGPMGALVSVLRQIETELLVVLAVDMPKMTADFLQSLMLSKRAVVPKNGVCYEPLAAVYARAGLPEMETLLRNGDRSLQIYLRQSVARGSVMERVIRKEEELLFANANTLDEGL